MHVVNTKQQQSPSQMEITAFASCGTDVLQYFKICSYVFKNKFLKNLQFQEPPGNFTKVHSLGPLLTVQTCEVWGETHQLHFSFWWHWRVQPRPLHWVIPTHLWDSLVKLLIAQVGFKFVILIAQPLRVLGIQVGTTIPKCLILLSSLKLTYKIYL